MKKVLRMSQMLSSSSEMRSAGLVEKEIEPELVVPSPNEAEVFNFGPDLEKVLRNHREGPVFPGASSGIPARGHGTGRAVAEQSSFPSEDPLAAAARPAADAAAESSVGTGAPPAPVLCDDAIARDYQALVEAARQIFAGAAKGRGPDSEPIIASVCQSYKQLLASEGLVAETVRHRRDFRAWPERAANVAVLSMRLGVEMELDERKCLVLGLCGLMHDVGMLKIPSTVLESSVINSAQLKILRQHPLESKKIIEGFGDSFAWIGKIVVQIHERWDGSGYPYGLKGRQLHELAGILGLADAYEAMVHPRPDRKAQPLYNALKQIIDQNNTQFQRALVKMLLRVVSIFPLGSLVRLNSGAIGRVIGTRMSHPTRPTLEILIDSRGQPQAEAKLVDLNGEPFLNIVDPAIEESVLDA